MIKRIFVISVVFLCSSVGPLLAHSSYKHHAREICDIFPFQYQRNDNDKMFYWAGYISSWLIDGVGYQDFESKIHKQFPQLTWSAGNHRIFFHWGFNSVPWNAELERLTKGWSPDKIKALKYLLINEQRKRNGYANRETEKLFHYQPYYFEDNWLIHNNIHIAKGQSKHTLLPVYIPFISRFFPNLRPFCVPQQ